MIRIRRFAFFSNNKLTVDPQLTVIPGSKTQPTIAIHSLAGPGNID